jgi:hypothetical protein
MGSFHSKRWHPRHRITAAAGGAAAAAAAVAGCTAAPGASPGVSAAPSSAPAASAARPAGAGLAANCTGAPLKSQLAAAVQGGASVIVATGTLAGKPTTGLRRPQARPRSTR